MFLQSTTLKDYINTNSVFHTPSCSYFFFFDNRYKYMLAPMMQSCVDITTSAMLHYMRAICKFIRINKDISNALDECTCSQHALAKQDEWQSYLNEYVEDFVKATCCSKVAHPSLNHGA